jgi:hypothetical protein
MGGALVAMATQRSRVSGGEARAARNYPALLTVADANPPPAQILTMT